MAKISLHDIRSIIKARPGGIAAAAAAMNMNPNYLTKSLGGKREFQTAEWLALAQLLERPLSDFVDTAEPSVLPRQQQNAMGEPSSGWTAAAEVAWPRNLPILGAAEGHNGSHAPGFFDLNTEVAIGYVLRPPRFVGRSDVYALYVVGDSMEPALAAGALLLVDPKLPPRIGDDVIVQLRDADGRIAGGMVKRLKRRTSGHVILEQFNPGREMNVPVEKIAAIHRTLTLSELLL